MKPLGNHFIIEMYDCSNDLSNIESVATVLKQSAYSAKATVVSDFFQQFNPWGVSGVIILAESHISIHSYPEYRYAAIDMFFCDITNIDVDAGIQSLKDGFGTTNVRVAKLHRGLEIEAIKRKLAS